MADVSSSLLDYVLSLLAGGDAADDFATDPEGALGAAGLSGVCGADLDAVLPAVLDYAPVGLKAAGVAGAAGGAGAAGSAGAAGGVWAAPIAVAPHGDHAAAVQTLQNIVQNYSYTSNDINNTYLDQSQNLDISTDGGDIDDLDVDFENNSIVTSGDDNVIGDDNNVGNTFDSHDVDIEDSFNDSHDDNSTNIDDSFKIDDNSDNSDNSTNDDSVNTDIDVDIEDSFQDNSDNSTDSSIDVSDNELDFDASTDNSVNTDIEDSFQLDVEDSFQANTDIDDSAVAGADSTPINVNDNEVDVDL